MPKRWGYWHYAETVGWLLAAMIFALTLAEFRDRSWLSAAFHAVLVGWTAKLALEARRNRAKEETDA